MTSTALLSGRLYIRKLNMSAAATNGPLANFTHPGKPGAAHPDAYGRFESAADAIDFVTDSTKEGNVCTDSALYFQDMLTEQEFAKLEVNIPMSSKNLQLGGGSFSKTQIIDAEGTKYVAQHSKQR